MKKRLFHISLQIHLKARGSCFSDGWWGPPVHWDKLLGLSNLPLHVHCSIPFNVSNLSLTAFVWKQLFKCQMSPNNCLYSHIIWLKCFLNHALCKKDSCCFHFVPLFVLSLLIILNGSLGKVQQIQEWTISKKKLHFPLSAWPHNSSNFWNNIFFKNRLKIICKFSTCGFLHLVTPDRNMWWM